MISGITQNFSEKKIILAVYATIILLCLVLFGITEHYLALAIPPALLVVFLAFFDYKVLFYLIFLTIPFSIDVAITGDSLKFGTPAEPLIGLLALIAITIFFTSSEDRKFLKSPASLFILVHLGLILITAAFTSMPLVSVKFLIVKISYILVFYFLAGKILNGNLDRFKTIFLLYVFAFLPVIVYILNNHSAYDFDKNVSNIITGPFYNDHTIYGACLCLVIPILTGVILSRKTFKISVLTNFILLFILGLLLTALFFTYSRAAWVSLGVSLGMAVVLLLKIRFRTFLIGIIIGSLAIFSLKNVFVSSLKQNKYDSNAHNAGLDEQLKSVTSIKKDVSNAERVNRWNSALRMFNEKPITGFGPGTYQFQYIPFQYSKDMTEISITSGKFATNPGVGGSAHSEYLLLLSESGIFAMLSFILLCFYIVYAAMDIYYKSENKKHQILAICAVSAFTGYLAHGFFNNFLDQEEAASLFWILIAAISVMKMNLRKKDKELVEATGN